MLSRRQLIQMVVDAYEACRSEAMFCPWCSGYISVHREEHDEFCLFTKLNLEFDVLGG